MDGWLSQVTRLQFFWGVNQSGLYEQHSKEARVKIPTLNNKKNQQISEKEFCGHHVQKTLAQGTQYC